MSGMTDTRDQRVPLPDLLDRTALAYAPALKTAEDMARLRDMLNRLALVHPDRHKTDIIGNVDEAMEKAEDASGVPENKAKAGQQRDELRHNGPRLDRANLQYLQALPVKQGQQKQEHRTSFDTGMLAMAAFALPTTSFKPDAIKDGPVAFDMTGDPSRFANALSGKNIVLNTPDVHGTVNTSFKINDLTMRAATPSYLNTTSLTSHSPLTAGGNAFNATPPSSVLNGGVMSFKF